MATQRRLWIRLAAAAAAGLMVAALFPPFSLSALVWVAFIPLLPALWSLDGKRIGWKGFGLGFLAGVISCGVQFSWLGAVSWLAAVILPLYLGCFWGLFGAFAATLGNPWRRLGLPHDGSRPLASLRTAFSHGAVWAGLELLRGWLFTGFGWNFLGVAFHETLVIAQAADLLGVAGLSLVVVFFQTALVQAGRRVLAGARGGVRPPRWDFGVAALVVALVLCYGILRIAGEGRGESLRLKSLLVQINIPQDAARVLWDALDVHQAYEDETLEALETLGAEDSAKLQAAIEQPDDATTLSLRWPDWVLWPETALTGRIFRADDGSWGMWQQNVDTIARVRSAGSFNLIYGVNELEAESSGGQLAMKPKARAYNSIAFMTPDDGLETFRKRHLVIFGETIPFVDSVPFLKKIYEQQSGAEYRGSFSPGESLEPVPVFTHGVDVGAIPTVCFEDTVPRLTRKFVRAGPQVIVNVTNDGWFKETSAAAQHFANARFRAIELRRPMLRCANSGVSAAIDTRGSTAHPDTGARQVLTDGSGSHFTRGWLLTELDVPLRPGFSLYARIGDFGIIFLSFVGFSSSLIVWTKERKTALQSGMAAQ